MASTTTTFIDGVTPLTAADINGFTQENNNLIRTAKMPLDTDDNTQTTQAVADYVNAGKTYYSEDAGSDTYNLINPDGLANVQNYDEGLHLYFRPDFSNTTTTPRLQLPGLSDIPIVENGGTAVDIGQLRSTLMAEIIIEEVSPAVFQAVLLSSFSAEQTFVQDETVYLFAYSRENITINTTGHFYIPFNNTVQARNITPSEGPVPSSNGLRFTIEKNAFLEITGYIFLRMEDIVGDVDIPNQVLFRLMKNNSILLQDFDFAQSIRLNPPSFDSSIVYQAFPVFYAGSFIAGDFIEIQAEVLIADTDNSTMIIGGDGISDDNNLCSIFIESKDK